MRDQEREKIWAAHQRARWLRPDAARYFKPGAETAVVPTGAPVCRQAEAPRIEGKAFEQSLREFERDHLALRRMVAELRLDLLRRLYLRKYDPSQWGKWRQLIR